MKDRVRILWKKISMRRRVLVVALSFVLLHLTAPWTEPCTTFVLQNNGEPLFGRNFDYAFGGGLLVVNKRNVSKTSATYGTPITWVSKYGSVTFNLYGRELPMGGMNERGFVIECMWLDESQYPPPDDRPTASDLQWIQYQLDNCATVSELLQHAADVRPYGYGGSKIHFLATDPTGDCAALEFLDGRLVTYTGKDLPVHALANSTYEKSLAFLGTYSGDENPASLKVKQGSLGRFLIAARAVAAFDKKPPKNGVEFAFETLKNAGFEDRTRWSIVYDTEARRIHFRTAENREVRSIAFSDLDFSCLRPVLLYDLTTAGSGNIAKELGEYSYDKNKALVTRTFTATEFLKNTPPSMLEYLSQYPTSCRCTEQP